MSAPVIHRTTVKKALRRELFPDTFTVSRYKFSPYMACSHGCAYCDGRAEKYYVEGNFDRDIVVRENLPDLLHRELSGLREWGPVCISSGVTDAYQPVEESLELTARCLDTLSWYDLPVTLLTKSALIERDIPVLEKIAARSGVKVYISLVHLDDGVRSAFEPQAGTVEQRLALIGKLKAAGCSVGILAMPFLPGLGDDPGHMEELFREVLNRGADFIMPGHLTLRPGRQKDFFMSRLGSSFPGLSEWYGDLFSNNLLSGNPLKGYRDNFYSAVSDLAGKLSFHTAVPHRIYRETLHKGDELFVLLCQMREQYGFRGIDTSRLSAGLDLYRSFLENEKKGLGRDIASNRERMNRLIPELCRSGKIGEILRNEKLGAFVSEIFLGDRLFDFAALNLI